MKMKRRRALEVPPKIRSFINNVTCVPLENIEEPLKGFVWEFDKGDFHHWVDLFNHFDSFFEKHIKSRKDLQVEDNFLGSDPPFPREAVLQILRVIRIILENCTNKHFYSSYEQHLSCLLASIDADIVEACLQTLAAFLKKSVGKYSIRDASLNSKLFALAQGWGGKEEGLGLIACALQNGCSQVTHELGCTLHFEFYALNESESEITEKSPKGLQIIHLPNVSSCLETDLELLSKLIAEFNVPSSLRFSLLTRMRFARAFHSLSARQQYTCIRLYAFIVLVQASGDADDLVTFFNSEPEFVNELVALLSYEDEVPVKIRILCLLSLVALCQDRSRQPTVLSAVTSGGHRGILSSLMQKAVDSVITDTTKWSILFAEALLSLVTVLVSSSSSCSAMREAGFIPTLLPLLKDTNPQHLHLVSTAVHILEVFMDYSNPAAALFRDLGGLDDTISRLKVEVSHVENGSKQQGDYSEYGGRNWQVAIAASSDLDDLQPFYSEALLSYHRRLLMKALLRAISLGTYAPGNISRFYGSEENLLPHCLCIIFRRAKDFGGGVFSLAATVMSDLIHKDPTCFSVLDATGLPAAFLDAVMDGVVCSAEAITCIPQCLDALCLNNNGLQAVRDRNALRCFVKIFTSRTYLRALTSDASGSLSSGLDELMRHASSLRSPGVDMLIEILNSIVKIGSSIDASCITTDPSSSSTAVPMETDVEEGKSVLSDDKGIAKVGNLEQSGVEPSLDQSMTNPESFLPDYVSNAARLLETVLQNADTCRIFVEKKGIEAVLQLFTLPLMPPSVSVGQSISVAFKNFSPQHSASLARAVCAFLREHLKSTNEFLVSVEGSQFTLVESSKQTRGLKHLSCLESILCLCNFLLKGTTTLVSELGTADADILKDLGRTYREIIWQISLDNHLKTDDKKSADQEPESSDATPSNTAGRESDDDANMPVVRYMNPVSLRNGSQSLWGGEREFLSVVRSSESLHRRSRHGLTRLRGGRTGRHLEPFNIDSEASAGISETSSAPELKKKSPEVLVSEILNKLAPTMRAFFTALVKGFTSSNRRRVDSGSLSSASKSLGTALSKIFLDALSFSGHSTSLGLDVSLPVKCRYLGKVVDDMAALTFDGRKRTCYSAMVNNFYVHGTFKELITTFEATSQLLWSLPYSVQNSAVDHEKTNEESNLSHSPWLFDTIQSYCRELEYFVNSTLLLSPNSASQVQQLIQPVAVGLSIGLFPVPRDPEVFVRMLQAQVLDVLLPVWNHPNFPKCHPSFVASIVSLVTHIYSGVGDVKRNRNVNARTTNPRFVPPPPDEATIATIVEMGFTRARAEEALRRVETNSVEMAMEWLFSHAEDPVQEDDELARALALSLGNSSESSKVDNGDKSMDVLSDEGHAKAPPVDDILTASMRLFQSSDTMAFTLTDLLVTLCNRNKGEDRPRVLSYLIQQLKCCPLDFTKDNGALGMLSHIIALLLFEDGNARKIAAQDGIVCAVIDILTNFKSRDATAAEVLLPKCVSALLLILDSMLQCRPKFLSENTDGSPVGSPPDASGGQAPVSAPMSIGEDDKTSLNVDKKESGSAFDNVLGKPTGYLTAEECNEAMLLVCDLIKQRVPGVIMQAVLQLCARLTKIHALALQFLENGGLVELFNLPRCCFFPGYDTVASAIVRHLLEDPQTLQTAMELEIRQTLSGSRHGGRTSARNFLTSMAAVISRDPVVFMKASAAVCQLDTSGGRTFVVLSKEKEKEKEKERSKVSGMEVGLPSNESVKISENKIHDGSGKCSKNHKKIPTNLTQVIDQLIEIVLKYPLTQNKVDSVSNFCSMEVDEPNTKVKGKSKVVDKKNIEDESEKSTGLAKVTFVLKLLSDILLMYVHAVGVILRRDSEMSQPRGCNHLDSVGQGGIVYHILQRLLPLSIDKSAGPDEWRDKFSEKASYFLVVLCGRSSEGRRRVINELVKALSLFFNSESNSNKNSILPDKRIFAFSNLAYSILSKNSSSSNLPGSGCSPDIAKSMIDGGLVQCLTNILQVIDLDHPDAPKIVNLILKALESLTRAANVSEQVMKSDGLVKKKSSGLNERLDDQTNAVSTDETVGQNQNAGSQQLVREAAGNNQQEFTTTQNDSNVHTQPNQSIEQEMRLEVEGTMAANPHMELGMEFMREEMEEAGVLHNSDQIEMTFRVENRADEEMGDEDDDVGDDAEDDDDDDDDGEDEDEDIADDGGGMMSLADTDVEDHDDTGLGDDYNDEMVDEEDDDFHENRVIEVRWREALDGLDHLQVLGQPGGASGLVDVAAEPFEGVNVDDLFGLRRPLGFERRRQTGRSSFERSVVEVNGFQHPLLLRPSQSGDMVSIWSSTGNSSRDLDTLSAGSYDTANFYVFDAPVFPYDHMANNLFGDRFGGTAPPPLADYPIGIDSLPLAGRRGPGDGRWTDDGQPQGGTQASAVAQAVEELFISHMHGLQPAEVPHQDSGVQDKPLDTLASNDNQVVAESGNASSQQNENQNQDNSVEASHHETNVTIDSAISQQVNSVSVTEEAVENVQEHEPMSIQPHALDITLTEHDRMDMGEQNGAPGGQIETLPQFDNLHCDGTSEVPADEMPSQAVNCPGSSEMDAEAGNHAVSNFGLETPNLGDCQVSSAGASVDVEMNDNDAEEILTEQPILTSEDGRGGLTSEQNVLVAPDVNQADQSSMSNEASGANAIDPTFLEALPEDLRAEVLASQQAQPIQPPTYAPPSADDIDPEFLAALPPDIQAEVLAQQRAQRVALQAEGQPVDMDNASIIATFPADLREEVLLTSSEAVLSALPSSLLAEAQMLRDRAMSHYQARSLFGNSHRLGNRRNGLGFDRQTVMDRGVGVTIGHRAASAIADSLKIKEIEGEPLLDGKSLKALIRLLRLAQPLGKGLLQRLLFNLCAHSVTRAILVYLLLDMIKSEAEGSAGGVATINSHRLYGCQSNVVYGRSQLLDGLPPLVLHRILEILTYLATNHSAVANMLFYFDLENVPEDLSSTCMENKKGKEKVVEGLPSSNMKNCQAGNVPLVLFLKLLNRPLFLRSVVHLEQVMSLLQVVVYTASSKLEHQSRSEQGTGNPLILPVNEGSGGVSKDPALPEADSKQENSDAAGSTSGGKRSHDIRNIFLQLPESVLCNLCALLGCEGLSDKVYALAGEVLKKLSSVAAPHRKFFMSNLSELANGLSSSAISELVTLKNTNMLGLSASSMAGAAIVRVLQALSSLISPSAGEAKSSECNSELEEQAIMWSLNVALEPLWQALSDCISVTETQLSQSSSSSAPINVGEQLQGTISSSPLPPGGQRLLPFIEAFFVLSEKLQENLSILQQDHASITAREVKESAGSSDTLSTKGTDYQKKSDGVVMFTRFAERHRRLLNAFIRQNPGLLEKSLSILLKAPRLIDFDNKRAYFRSRIRQQNEQHISGQLRISVRRAYVLEDSYNQLRMRPTQDLRGRLNVQFQGEEGIDAGGLTREWYQLLSRVIFDKGALLFTTVGNNATFQPNPNSVYQTEHLSYFKFVGRVVAKALYDGQLLDVYFTRSFYKHILGVKVTYHDIEAVDPDYYKNLKWMLENDVSDIPDLSFSMDADEEKHILYEKNEVTDFELKPGGRNIRVTEETKHEYVDLVADHILTNAIRPQINSFLDGFNELVPRELISIFNDKELELLISGLPEIDLDDLKVNTEYTGYTAASSVVQWFWEVVKSFSKEDMARLLQFVTGTSKVPLEGFKALQGISGPQRFQIHKAYGAPDRLPSAHTCFNQLDLPEYSSKEQLQERLLLAIHEASEGFGFG
ncbi:E3 ubiquitin-protein ligase UPL1-like isoform X1 [Cucurbita pepo subsp. pepo]|uniref:E3 ubiquitin-protein ligase UPL1-like isoform X1 n=1 Tax=Cucurbita pepo subsp. pepo TaxID=3664 RepID=UPI000C9D828E|nr:E3 ubiquitin-protein ligase UPL1-like isoform X1 [Cucurbita pepo subsp. pepo]XP_023540405.1 E3 ubiquitin-protein ligase UPL1-like isoform X1 [Cucurbita pepo subsp. pepo]